MSLLVSTGIVNWVTTADGCVHTDDTTKLSPTSREFVYTPPTRRDSTVSSRRRRRCVLGFSTPHGFWINMIRRKDVYHRSINTRVALSHIHALLKFSFFSMCYVTIILVRFQHFNLSVACIVRCIGNRRDSVRKLLSYRARYYWLLVACTAR